MSNIGVPGIMKSRHWWEQQLLSVPTPQRQPQQQKAEESAIVKIEENVLSFACHHHSFAKVMLSNE
jgi:hypothetical protein